MSNMNTYKGKAKKVVESAKNAASNTIDAATKNPKTTLYIVGVVISVYLIYKIATATSDKITSILEGDPNIDDKVIGTGGQIIKQNVTITEFQAKNFAQQLLDAMNEKQPLYGTDEEMIEKVFDQLKTKDDFLMVFKAFGEKDYNGNNSPPTGIWSNIDSYKKQNLVYWLKSELQLSWLSTATDKRVHQKVKNLVIQAGFAF